MNTAAEGVSLQHSAAARQARAALLRTPQTPLSIEDIQVGEPRADEVLMRLHGTGICHTALSIRDGFPSPLPIMLGQEGAGVVEAVGSAVTTLKAGDHVVTAVKPPIEFWFDFISPFGYFASLRIDALATAHGRQTDWTSMLLGVSVNKVMGIPPVVDLPLKGEYLVRDAQRYARQQGVPFRRSSPHPTSNPLLAGRCFAWAKQAHPIAARALAAALYHRYFVDVEDIGAEEVVSAALQDAGLDPLEWLDALCSGAPSKLLRGNVEHAIARGVFGSPFFIVDGEPFFGVEKLPVLGAWLQSGGW